jgi:SAM-dependent methyltransferase
MRVNFLHAALEAGALEALQSPSTMQELGTRLAVKRPELLESLLELGIALKELGREGDRYHLRGARARALAGRDGDFLAAYLEEAIAYHGSAYRHLAERMRGAELGDYLSIHGELIARSSRILEPFVGNFARLAARSSGITGLLEAGCGSGVYLRYAAEANRELTGIGIDLQEDVIAQAKANLARWGLGERFEVLVCDVMKPSAEWTGTFDLVTLYNNIYYFPVQERIHVLRTIRGLLRPGGTLALVSAFHGSDPEGINFDLVLRSTAGCAPLPKLDELRGQLAQAGFAEPGVYRLAAGDWLYGLLAQA